MQKFASIAFALSGLVASVSAHGYITSPPRRAPGPAMQAVCGSTIYNNQASDNAGPVQLLMQSASSIVDAEACNLWLCKGYQFDDNTANVQSYTLGQTIDMKVNIVAPHTGFANVSIVDTKSNTVKGSSLIAWDVYASTSTGVTADQTSFSFDLPTDLAGCTTAGECVIQWYWYAPPGVDQTYEGCVDFVIADGTASPTTSAAAEPTTSAVVIPTTSAVEITSSTIVEVPTTSAIVEVPTSSVVVEIPTTSAVVEVPSTTVIEVPTTSAAPIESSSAAPETTTEAVTSVIPTTSAVVVTSSKTVVTAVPTTLITKTRTRSSTAAAATTSAPASGSGSCSNTSAEYNKCLDAINDCIRNAQSKTGGAVDFSKCDAQRSACKMC